MAQFNIGNILLHPPLHERDEHKPFHAAAQFYFGRTILNQKRPDVESHRLLTAIAQIHTGKTVLTPARHATDNLNPYAGLAQFYQGRTILYKVPDKNIQNRLAAVFLLDILGKIFIPSRGVYQEDDEFIRVIEPDRIIIIKRKPHGGEDYLPYGDVIILYFKFPRRNRSLLFHNPRDNLTREEIKAVGDWVAEKQILTNIHQEFPSGICRVDLIKTHTTILF